MRFTAEFGEASLSEDEFKASVREGLEAKKRAEKSSRRKVLRRILTCANLAKDFRHHRMAPRGLGQLGLQLCYKGRGAGEGARGLPLRLLTAANLRKPPGQMPFGARS
jgi:hypothetical protein